jgi:hypothetical protein
MGQVQYSVAQKHHQLFVFPIKCAHQRAVAGFTDDPFPHPLPKLSLRCPKLLAITTDHQGSFLLLLFFLFVFRSAGLFCGHHKLRVQLPIDVDTRLPRHVSTRTETRSTPKGNLKREAALDFQKRPIDFKFVGESDKLKHVAQVSDKL